MVRQAVPYSIISICKPKEIKEKAKAIPFQSQFKKSKIKSSN
ncbi:hypothetical protein CBFG_05445 [Clostridiales bacterium 1_7_47FAA]|nr:hypothetical protein CBFG_05445 [Clostridiales bacterium 1_7_47FAA]